LNKEAGVDFDLERLVSHLGDVLPDLGGGFRHIEKIGGGQSNPTFRLSYGDRDVVLRKQPAGELLPSAHAVDREYRVQNALALTDVPVPASVEERAAIYASMNDALAKLHKVDWRAAGLDGFGKPENYFERQIKRWTRQWESSKTKDIPEIERLIAWLPEHVDQSDETTIVHGDYRLGNLMFHPDRPELIAILDWELSTLGHPLADLAFNGMLWHATPDMYVGIAGHDLQALGIPNLDDYVQHYCRTTGRADGITIFHLAFSMFRFAVIFEGIAKRALLGNAASDNAEEIGLLSEAYAKLAWSLVEKG